MSQDKPASRDGADAAQPDCKVLVGFPSRPDEDDFDWQDADSESIVTRESDAVAVYINPYGQVVIRRECHWDSDDGDVFIVIDRDAVPRLAERLLDVCDMWKGDHGERSLMERAATVAARTAAMIVSRPDIDWDAVNDEFEKMQEDFREEGAKLRAARNRPPVTADQVDADEFVNRAVVRTKEGELPLDQT